jgi:hypothetical protein
MPCGGGDIGANVWVENGDLLLYVDRSGNIDENDQQLKTGRIRVRFDPSPFIEADGSGPSAFEQRLRLRTGCVEIESRSSACGVCVKIWVDVHNPAIHIEAQTTVACSVTASYENWRLEKVEIPETLDADGNRAEWDFNRWSMFGYFWYRGKVYTYPDVVTARPDRGAIEFYHRNGDDLIFDKEIALMRIDPSVHPLAHPTRDRQFGGMLFGYKMSPIDGSSGEYAHVPYRAWRICSDSPSLLHRVQLFLHTEQCADVETWRAHLDQAADGYGGQAPQISLSERREASAAWWEKFWQRSHIVINPDRGPDDFGWQVGRNYNVFRYQLGMNAYGELPTRFNGGLLTWDPGLVQPQPGKFNPAFFNPDFRAWGAWTAQNQRLVYWPMLKCGDFDAMTAQFEFYRRNMPNAVARTASAWGIAGASFCEQVGTGALPLGSHYGWEPPFGARDPEREVGLSVLHETYYTTQLEFAFMIHEWRRHCGGDVTPYLEFLKQVVVLHFEYFGMLEERRTGSRWDTDGKLVLDPSHALETYHGRNATDVVLALRYNIERLLDLPEDMLESSERARFADWLGRLPEVNFRMRNGRKTISPVVADEAKMGNVELPQLYPTFPWPLYTVGKPDLQVAIDTWRFGMDRFQQDWLKSESGFPARDEWYGWTQQAIFLARMGLTEDARAYLVKKLADARGGNTFETDSRMRFPTFWGPGFDWSPDHNWGGSGMIALQEMLLQTTDDRIFVLPAWPADWDVDFKLHAPMNTVVRCRYRNGAIESVEVSPKEREGDLIPAVTSMD